MSEVMSGKYFFLIFVFPCFRKITRNKYKSGDLVWTLGQDSSDRAAVCTLWSAAGAGSGLRLQFAFQLRGEM